MQTRNGKSGVERTYDELDRALGSQIPLQEPEFLAGAVTKALGVSTGRLQKFVRRYQITPAEHFGSGPGSRRVFSRTDVYRLAVVVRLFQDGFSHGTIEDILDRIDVYQLLGVDSEGGPSPVVMVLRRAKETFKIDAYSPKSVPPITRTSAEYYRLDLDLLRDEVDAQLPAARNKP
jgi:MerR HTH family regulatory protein